MKKYPVFYIALCIAFLVITLPQCKKHAIPPTRLNITLYDKPLDTIKSYISGKWKLEYTYGGYIANLRTDLHDKDHIWQIDSGVNIKQRHLGDLITDTSIEWFLILYDKYLTARSRYLCFRPFFWFSTRYDGLV